MVNEFHGRDFTCSGYVPNYPVLTGNQFICSITGAIEGQRFVSGDQYTEVSYQYYYSHIWRNLGIMIGFLIFFEAVYLLATELNSETSSAAEVLVFRRGHVPKYVGSYHSTCNSNNSLDTCKTSIRNKPMTNRSRLQRRLLPRRVPLVMKT